MRVRDHIALSAAAAAVARPWLRSGALGLWAGGVVVDVDHYAWFCLRKGRWSPVDALRYFNQAHPQQPATRLLHTPLVPVALLLLGAGRPALRPVGAGVAVHLLLDAYHEARMLRARTAALERDGFACQACGERAVVETHLHRQPWLMPSYAPRNLVAVCTACHEAAHLRNGPGASWN